MNARIEEYAKAFVESTVGKARGESSQITRRFARLLKDNGDIRKADRIIESIEKNILSLKGGKRVEIEVARESALRAAKMLEKSFFTKDRVHYRVNPSLIAGVRITVNGDREFDLSVAGKLKRVFS